MMFLLVGKISNQGPGTNAGHVHLAFLGVWDSAEAIAREQPAQSHFDGNRNDHPVETKTDHELRFKLDQSVGADHIGLRTKGRLE